MSGTCATCDFLGFHLRIPVLVFASVKFCSSGRFSFVCSFFFFSFFCFGGAGRCPFSRFGATCDVGEKFVGRECTIVGLWVVDSGCCGLYFVCSSGVVRRYCCL